MDDVEELGAAILRYIYDYHRVIFPVCQQPSGQGRD